MKSYHLLVILLIFSLYPHPSIVSAEVRDHVSPPKNLGSVPIGTQVKLEYSVTFSESSSSLVIILIDPPPSGLELVEYRASMDDVDVTDQFSQLVIDDSLYFNCTSLSPTNGELKLTITFEATAQGAYNIEWRSIFTSFKEPPNPPSFIDVSGESSVQVFGELTEKYRVILQVEGLDSASTNVYVDGELYDELDSENPVTLFIKKEAYPIVTVDRYVNSSSDTRYICEESSWTPAQSLNQTHRYSYSTQYMVSIEANHGTVLIQPESGDRFYDNNQAITIEASADETTYQWMGWLGGGNGSYTGKDNPTSIKVTNPINLKAFWALKEDIFIQSLESGINNTIDFPEIGITIRLNVNESLELSAFEYNSSDLSLAGLPARYLDKIIGVSIQDNHSIEWPIYIEMRYTDEESKGLEESRLRMFYYSDGSWKLSSRTDVNVDENFVWTKLNEYELWCHPITLGEIAEPATPEITIQDMTIQPATIYENDVIQISVLLKNHGSGGETIYQLYFDDQVIQDLYVHLNEDESKEIKVSYNVTDKVGQHRILVADVSRLISVLVAPSSNGVERARFEFESIGLSSLTVAPGEDLTVRVKVKNIGDKAGNVNVNLFLDDVEKDSKATLVEKGVTAELEFHVTENRIGEHVIRAGTLQVTFMVKNPPLNVQLVLIIGGVVIALAFIVIVLRSQDII